jgi:hypothetical protein
MCDSFRKFVSMTIVPYQFGTIALDSSWSRYGNDQTGTAVVDVVILISLYLDRKDNIRIKNDI